MNVLVEGKIWKEFFEGNNVKEVISLEKLLAENKVIITGFTIVQILKNVKDKELFDKLLKGFLSLPYVEIEKEDWIRASKLIFNFEDLSVELALLCSLSQRKKLRILTKDEGIKEIEGVKLYEDEKE